VDSTSAARSPDRSVLISIAANVKAMPGLSSKAVPFSYITRQLFFTLLTALCLHVGPAVSLG